MPLKLDINMSDFESVEFKVRTVTQICSALFGKSGAIQEKVKKETIK